MARPAAEAFPAPGRSSAVTGGRHPGERAGVPPTRGWADSRCIRAASTVGPGHPPPQDCREVAVRGPIATAAYSVWVLDAGGHGPSWLVFAAGWFASFFGGQVLLGSYALVLLLAPEGRLPSRRWRAVLATTVLGIVLFMVPPLLEPAVYAGTDPQPVLRTSRVLHDVSLLLLAVGDLAAVAALVRSRVGATGARRAQLRWFSAAAAALGLTLAWYVAVGLLLPGNLALSLIPLFLAILVLPVAVAVAVLRYRLYDIDVIINRAWLLLSATVLITGAYVALVVLVGASVRGFWRSLLAAALVACLFQPLRQRLVTLADRVAYGSQAQPYLALAELSRRLGQVPDQRTLLAVVAATSSQAVGARAAAVELLQPDGRSTAVATAPADTVLDRTRALRLPIHYGGQLLGALWVEAADGRALRRRDVLVLNGFSEQAGVAFRNLHLDAELSREVADLAGVVSELERFRRDTLTARADEMTLLQTAVDRAVIPRLDVVRGALPAIADASSPTAWLEVDAAISAAKGGSYETGRTRKSRRR